MYHYKRPEPSRNINGNLVDLANTSPSLKYQSGLIQEQLTTDNSITVAANTDPNFNLAHRASKNIKIVVPLKYISNFFRSLEFL